MSEPSHQTNRPEPLDTDLIDAGLWPSADYRRQVERLRAAVGETLYLVELVESAIQLGVQLTGQPFELLGVIDFPRPDPTRGLAPHLLLLDDGRGVNLGRIARVSRRPFAPASADLLYLDQAAHQHLLFAERRLSRDFLTARSRAALGECLGYAPPELARLLAGPPDDKTDLGRGI
ncbi:hypothetical protein [Thiocystis violascens]|uniref:Uncharacterized protein n=1 Tax=Thiocystis violascens (strain ATCC 17096 / DSM 198 / 6111) TaxID=765911 RepID=I3YH21_THIV6|nr:hypothetical protein [Thiocystis violascens]AFL76289.1 hypothetical protein Thivi_4493 [Thiocystis violascens DSM 198]